MTTDTKRLIYGKNDLEYITSIEVVEDKAYIFRELPNGDKDTQIVSNRYWILAPYNLDKTFNRLDGDLHYKWGKQFSSRQDFLDYRKKNYGRDIYSIKNAAEALMVKDGYTCFQGLKHTDPSILSFDIESTGLEHNSDSKIILISNTFRSATGIQKRLFSYENYENCAEMVKDWAKWIVEIDPSIICGHNIYGYDFGYIQHCHNMYSDDQIILGKGDKPITFEDYESKFRVDGSRDLHYKRAHIFGRQIVDTMFLAYKYDLARKYESYGLKKIIAQEKLEKEGRTFYDASLIRVNYKDPVELEKIKEYAKDDADDSLALYDLMGPVMFYLCPVVPKQLQSIVESASGSQINSVMVRSYLQEKHSVAKASPVEEYEGAISFAVPGIYSNLFKIDFSALYPSIMMQYEVCDTVKDPRRNFLTILKYFAEYRQEYKRLYKETGEKQYDYLQGVAKTIANSCYGFMGAAGLNYNAPHKAAEVTAKGRELLEFSIQWATSKKASEWIELFKEKTK